MKLNKALRNYYNLSFSHSEVNKYSEIPLKQPSYRTLGGWITGKINNSVHWKEFLPCLFPQFIDSVIRKFWTLFSSNNYNTNNKFRF